MAAATAVSVTQNPSSINQAIAYQSFAVNMHDDTTITLTPTAIKAIYSISWVPTNATAATGATATYVGTFVPGQGTLPFVGVTSGTYLVTVGGTIA